MCKMCFRTLTSISRHLFLAKGGGRVQVLNIKYDYLMLSITYPDKVSQWLFIIHKQLTNLQGAIGYAIHNCYTVVAYSRGVLHSSWSVFRFICNLYF